VRYLLRSATIEAELRAAKAAVEEASVIKSRLFAALCRELRTPLNGVLGFAEAISSEMLGPIGDKGYLEFARDIWTSGDALLTQVNRMLLLSKLESGAQPLKPSSAAVEPLLIDIAKQFTPRADEQAIAINICLASAPLRIEVDTEIILAAVTVLIANAVAFLAIWRRY
jgi:two-component system cell cycle sensor histidine kinase PleC